MLIASPLGQTVTAQEVAVEIRDRGYYPLPVTPPPPDSPPVYDLRTNVITPPVTPPVITMTYTPAVTLPAPDPTPWPATPQPHLQIIRADPLTLPVDQPSLIDWTQIDTLPVQTITRASLPDSPPLFEPKWQQVDPVISLPDSPPLDEPSLTKPVIEPDIPQVIIDDFPGWTVLDWPELIPDTPPLEEFIQWPETLIEWPDVPETPPVEEFPPEKKTPWLLIAVIGGILLLGGEKKPKRPQKRLPERRPEVMREEYAI